MKSAWQRAVDARVSAPTDELRGIYASIEWFAYKHKGIIVDLHRRSADSVLRHLVSNGFTVKPGAFVDDWQQVEVIWE